MRRADGVQRRFKQGSVPILAGALLACTTAGSTPDGTTAPRWLASPPPDCSVGFSGPTLNPGHAIRQARKNALENLAAERLGVRVESELRISGGWVSEITHQEISGIIAGSRIVAMASGAGASGGSQDGLREVYALACPTDTDTPDIPKPGFPDWILNIPSQDDRLCVPGIGGPTRKPEQQSGAALRDGRDALAHALESDVQRQTLDDGRGLARVSSQTESTEQARAIAESVEQLEEEWLDRDGRGPLELPGVLYGLVCVSL